jgi:hypothetical protein
MALLSLTVRSGWSGRPDSNRGPPAPKAGALPDCATPRATHAPEIHDANAADKAAGGPAHVALLAYRSIPEAQYAAFVVLLTFIKDFLG